MVNIPRIHNIWPPRRENQEFMKNDSVIQSSAKARSSSCQCSTTLFGEKKKMWRNVKVILAQLRIMLADFLAVIDHSWDLDHKRNGTELVLLSLMEFGTKLPKK